MKYILILDGSTNSTCHIYLNTTRTSVGRYSSPQHTKVGPALSLELLPLKGNGTSNVLKLFRIIILSDHRVYVHRTRSYTPSNLKWKTNT